ncbi:Secondary metabolism regulator LAE1 [Paramyrothecium foliicola]|nr:Secondary metabolism regulator LAE1 [Paramyrothecium foliicola]
MGFVTAVLRSPQGSVSLARDMATDTAAHPSEQAPEVSASDPPSAPAAPALPAPTGPNVYTQPVLDVADAEDVDDDEFDPQEFDLQSAASTSIRSSILEHEYEHGRRYHHYRHGRYPLPNDDAEQGRDNTKHVIHLESCDGKLFNAPISENAQRILDLCTGTGLWAIEIADQFPSAEVIGLDLSPIQPAWVPPNVRFLIDDIEDEWVDENQYDFIHMRHSCAYLKDVDRLLRQCYEHLAPGGWVEISDFGGYALCDDGTMPPDYPLNECFALVRKAMAKYGANFLVANEHEEHFKNAGFKNVQCRIVKTPIGTWPKDKTQRLVGMYFKEVIQGLVVAMGNKPLRTVGMSDAELEVFLSSVRRCLADSKIHSYFNFISWWGQK